MTAKEFFRLLLHRLWSTDEILQLVRPANAPLPERTWKPCPGEFRPVTEENINDCGQFEDAAHYIPVYREMIQRGDFVHFGYLNGKCVYRHAAQCSGDVVWGGCFVRHLQSHEIHTHFSYCAPDARGGGWQMESLRIMFETYPDCTAYTEVKKTNIPALISNFRVGYRPYSVLTVKNRLLHRSLTERKLSPEEISSFVSSVMQSKST